MYLKIFSEQSHSPAILSLALIQSVNGLFLMIPFNFNILRSIYKLIISMFQTNDGISYTLLQFYLNTFIHSTRRIYIMLKTTLGIRGTEIKFKLQSTEFYSHKPYILVKVTSKKQTTHRMEHVK